MKIEDVQLIDDWLFVNPKFKNGSNQWQYIVYGSTHTLSEANELYKKYLSDHPDYIKLEHCEKIGHSNSKPENRIDDYSWDCEKCGAKIRKCGALNTIGT